MQRYRLEKITIGAGVGKLRQMPNFEDKVLPEVINSLALIAGQYPSKRAAKKSIATFKTRTGDVVGLMATLRGARMRDFLYRLINIALPRVRDFRGIDVRSVDGRGNLSIGIKEHTIFPEINPEKVNIPFGIQVTLTASTKNRNEGLALLKTLELPFKKVS